MNASADDLRARFDVRALIRLCFDDDEVHVPGELGDSAVLKTALADAEGSLEAAVSVSGIYSKEQMNSLDPASAELAKRIVCELAFAFLASRRGTENNDAVKEKREQAEAYLDRLRKGERLFVIDDDDSKQAAGRPNLVAPSAVDLIDMNGITQRASVYFGPVAREMPFRKFLGD